MDTNEYSYEKYLKHLELSLRMVGIGMDIQTIDTVLEVSKSLHIKRGEFSLNDACDIEAKMIRKYHTAPEPENKSTDVDGGEDGSYKVDGVPNKE